MKTYRPITIAIQELDANGEPKPKTSIFEIHLGRPGKPLVYRRRRGQLTKVPPDDAKTLRMVADALRRSTDAAKVADERREKSRKRWWYRFFVWCHGLPDRLARGLSDAIGPSWRSWFS